VDEQQTTYSTTQQVVFWYWQYISRNVKYREFVDSLVLLRQEVGGTSDSMRQMETDCYRMFRCHPANYNIFTDSSLIVNSFVEGNLEYSRCPSVTLHDFAETLYVYPVKDNVVWDRSDFHYRIATKKPLKQVLAEVEYLYHRVNDFWVPGSGETPSQHLARQSAFLAHYDYKILGITEKTVRRQEGRIVGLWMYDYIASQGKLKRGIKSQAKRAFVERFGENTLRVLGYADSDVDTFRNLYENAAICVNRARLIPTS